MRRMFDHRVPWRSFALFAAFVAVAVLPAAAQAKSRGGATLIVRVNELPRDAGGAVHVRGPRHFARELTHGRRLRNLRPGVYRIAARGVRAHASLFVPHVSVPRVRVRARGTSRVSVSYRSRVPNSTRVIHKGAFILVSGAPGGRRTLVMTKQATGLTPPRVGQVLVAGVTRATPDGLIGRVRAIRAVA